MAILPCCHEQDYQAIDNSENADKLSLEEDRISPQPSQSHLPPPSSQDAPRQVPSEIKAEFDEIQIDWPVHDEKFLQDCLIPALYLLFLSAVASGVIYVFGIGTRFRECSYMLMAPYV
ncbi:hypothetical protein VE01_08446 [Pseudogymnoascus verrucosus]|uniref:Uncharacterized protein n=1 Tax=Pseudogymnoascus verrucosus TaxID=342668 RepID=A0A1B8GBR8_9PEZI|nr:uncharacterized protein VE01_08446 [Pseudogymnoascus verrucosus]OBT93289.1 hypothetical protein VE01_08446 [Pseudogymnoascus verrucosus]